LCENWLLSISFLDKLSTFQHTQLFFNLSDKQWRAIALDAPRSSMQINYCPQHESSDHAIVSVYRNLHLCKQKIRDVEGHHIFTPSRYKTLNDCQELAKCEQTYL